MDKNYNSGRKKMNLPEYGRNIFKMVEFLQTIEERPLRNQQAQVVIDVMGNINNHLRDTDDLKHKLWDHLFIISNFRLDVDSPYPRPDPDVISPKPECLPYPNRRVAYKHYGKYAEKMLIDLGREAPDDDRKILVGNIAKYMRNKSHEYNQEHPSNEVIINDIRLMSKHAIDVEDDILEGSRSDFRPQAAIRAKGGKNPKGGKNNNQKPGGRKPVFKKY